ncbi:DNA cytosine methyltransferase [Vibrio parahaemolyticus]|nr:DNA cytosine methyltransferase [Vibrio parahaemolyticus]EHJ9984516.1 DNA cytosine methyltransferase [Vibrio parahaemolyticus]EKA7379447.1 DNA cytosine methyltransferase [Vibrio parahaemolyticus]
MYERLIQHLKNTVVNFSPKTAGHPELEAELTHWLQTEEVNLFSAVAGLPETMRNAADQFEQSNGTTVSALLEQLRFPPLVEPRFDFIDLFAGIGGFNLGLSRNGGRCVFASEWDKAAKKTYFNNYGKVPYGDINQFTGEGITEEELDSWIPNHQVLAGGFPCQPFSHAGVSARTALGLAHGFDCDTQGNLFHSIAKIAFVKQPEVVFMENVKNIVTHNGGETFETIKNTMEQLSGGREDKQNYRFFHAIINSETVVAQRRVRCFMVCVREDIWQEQGDFVFPEFLGESIALREAIAQAGTTPEEAAEYTISDRLWQGHINRTQRNLARNTGFTAHEANLDRPSNTIVARYGKDGKECLIPQEGANPRKLTINECRVLFGYPDNFWHPEVKTPAYKQFGNSVVVPVVSQISESITNYLQIANA